MLFSRIALIGLMKKDMNLLQSKNNNLIKNFEIQNDLSNKKFEFLFQHCFLYYLFIYITLKVFYLFILFISAIFLVLGVLDSKVLKPLQILWIKFGFLLNKLITPIIMFVIYFFVYFLYLFY